MPRLVDEVYGNVYLGIDPGRSGGAAIVTGGHNLRAECFSFSNATDRQIWEWLKRHAVTINFAMIEQNTGYIGSKDGKDQGNPGSAMFVFGKNTGIVLGFLIAADIPYREVPPHVWQKELSIPKRKYKEKKGDFKRRLREHAERLFPKDAFTQATCDAALIAEYCRRAREGIL